MFNVFAPLVSSGLYDNQGIQDINVFYDTLFIDFIAFDSDNTNYNNLLLIQKINYDYSTNLITGTNKNFLIDFGDTQTFYPKNTNGNCFIDNILLEKEKLVLVCGLSSGGLSANGQFLCPLIYQYDINNNTLKKLYSSSNDSQWNNYLFGVFDNTQFPLVSFNNETRILNYIFKTTITAGTSSIEAINDIEFLYTNNLQLNNVRVLTSFGNSNFNSFTYVKFKNYNNNQKIVFAQTDNSSLVPFML